MPASKLQINTGVNATAMANEIFDDSVKVVSASYQGDNRASGIFRDGDSVSPGATPGDQGVILSTGRARDYTNENGEENQSLNTSTNVNGIDEDGFFDRAILTVDFIPDHDVMTMQFLFASEEYPEFQNTIFQDAFTVTVNGTPAKLDVGNGDIDPANINSGINANLYNDNASDSFNTEMDGFTVTMTLTMDVMAGATNTMQIAIGDVFDSSFDSAVLIAADSIQTDLVAVTDTATLTASGSTTIAPLDNDIAKAGASLLSITHINGMPVSAGSQVTLPSGQKVQLNADATITIVGDGDVEDFSFTYSISNFLDSDTGIVNVSTVPCFTPGTMIATPEGETAVEKLQPGDLVLTRDDGPQPLRWCGKRTVAATGDMAPVRIRAGTFGDHRQLLVSPQHRVLIRDDRAHLLFGEVEVLVPAKDLVDDVRVTRVRGGLVTYVHLLFDRHQIVLSQGLETESFLPGPLTTSAFERAALEEIQSLFPDLNIATGAGYSDSARRGLKRFETAVLMQTTKQVA